MRELSTLPLRGAPVREVADIHPQGFRQVFFHSYRVIYAVIGPNVVVLAMADGRRELTELLRRRVARRGGGSAS